MKTVVKAGEIKVEVAPLHRGASSPAAAAALSSVAVSEYSPLLSVTPALFQVEQNSPCNAGDR